jgi:transcriptional regulator with XRE-family HTH domain
MPGPGRRAGFRHAAGDSPQAQVAERMGVGKSRVSQIETGKVATRDVLDRYVEALGGRLSLMADFGDELLRVG